MAEVQKHAYHVQHAIKPFDIPNDTCKAADKPIGILKNWVNRKYQD